MHSLSVYVSLYAGTTTSPPQIPSPSGANFLLTPSNIINATLDPGIILSACNKNPLYNPPFLITCTNVGVKVRITDGDAKNCLYEVGTLNFACWIFCIGYETAEYAIDAVVPARRTNAGARLQCGFFSFGRIRLVEETGR